MRTRAAILGAVLLLAACGLALAADPGPPSYLPGGRAPDPTVVLPPAPIPGSPAAQADRQIFLQTRALEGTARWRLAQNDVVEATPAMLADFSCAAGVTLDAADAPQLAHMLERSRPDVITAVNRAKALYPRKRPFVIDEGDICVPRAPGFADSPDYPSGHATWSWALGLILAELEPDRAGPILSRARAFGESRVVCGVHNASAVDAGRTNGAAIVAALHGQAAFRSDLEAVRRELADLRARAPAPEAQACAAEAALTARTPW